MPFGEALPAWRVALYQPRPASPRATWSAARSMLFIAAFGLLLVVIAAGLVATYRLVRRESEMARLKSDFVANVSHDLKTPLAADPHVRGDARDGPGARRAPPPRVLRRASRARASGSRRLIDNVLDFSRIESGRQRYEIAAGAVEPIVHEVVESFRHPLDQQGFKVDVAIEPDLPDVPAGRATR